MKNRILIILNALGCLFLSALVTAQWLRERESQENIAMFKKQLTAAMDFSAEETMRAAALERDIDTLKESLEMTIQAAEESARAAAESSAKASSLEAEITAAREQLKTWQAALAERDAKLRSLDSELAATRQRLNIAIEKLKVAASQ